MSAAAEVCFNELGCFDDLPPWGGTPQRPASVLPWHPEEIGTRFLLFTQKNRNYQAREGFIFYCLVAADSALQCLTTNVTVDFVPRHFHWNRSKKGSLCGQYEQREQLQQLITLLMYICEYCITTYLWTYVFIIAFLLKLSGDQDWPNHPSIKLQRDEEDSIHHSWLFGKRRWGLATGDV